MGRSFSRYLLVPMLLWLCPTFAGAAILNSVDATVRPVAGYCLAAPTLIFTWWGINLSRWMHRRYGWGRVPYLITNGLIGMCFWGLSLAFAVALMSENTEETTLGDTIGALVFLAGFFVGAGWLLRSFSKLISSSQEKYQGLHWQLITTTNPLKSSAATIPLPQTLRPPSSQEVNQPRNSAAKPAPRAKSPETIFRPVMVEDKQPQIGRSIPVPPRISPPPPRQTGVQIPAAVQPDKKNLYTSPPQASVSFSSRRGSFVEQAKQLVNRTERQAEHVPFMQYWPNYAAMSKAQQQWYFYWRAQVRRGNFLPTDLSYLFVHIYEALNLIGFSSAQVGFSHLERLWKHYRTLQPKLDNYLVDWLADFIVVHKLPTTPLKWYGVALRNEAFSGDMDMSIEAWLAAGGDFHDLPTSLLYKWLGYTPSRSKFFATYGKEYQLERAYQDGLQAVEQSLRETQTSLFQIYRPRQTRAIQRAPFAGALHDLEVSTITIGEVHPWTSREDLISVLASIIKYVENIKRAQAGYSPRLRGIELPREWGAVLDKAFTQPEPRREIVIDMDKVAQLKRESEEIRERLLDGPIPADEQPSHEILFDELITTSKPTGTPIQPTIIDTGPMTTSGISAVNPGYTQRPDDAPSGLLTDLPQVSQVIGRAGSRSAEILKFLWKHGWETPLTSVPVELHSGSFLSIELDTINERAKRILGEDLIVEEAGRLLVTEDYRDEVAYILEHPDFVPEAAPTEVFSALSEEWARFAQQMKPFHWEALAALLHTEDVHVRLEAIARSEFTTVNLLVDEINNIAQDNIGDIVIDTEQGIPQIEEEDVEGLQALVAWAMQQALVEG